MSLRLGLVVLATVTFSCSCLKADDWTQFRGPERTGHSSETGLLREWPESGPKLLWQVDDLGAGFGSPAVVGDRIFLINNRGNDNEFVHARSTKDGSEIWSTRIGNVGRPNQRPSYPGARSTPTVDGDHVYVFGSDGDLVCLTVADGEIVWQRNVSEDFGGESGQWAYTESPLVDGKAVVCAPGGKDATMVAVDKSSGETIWTCPVPGGDKSAYSSTIVVEADGVRQYVQFVGGGVVGVDAETGKFLWRYDATVDPNQANMPTPVAQGNLLYNCTGRGGCALLRLEADQGGVSAEQVYYNNSLPNSIGGSVRVGDYLYGTNKAGLICADFASGEVLWQDRSIGESSVLFADGLLLFHGEDGSVSLVEASPEEFRGRGQFTLPGIPERSVARSKAWAYPALADGRLYVHDFGTLWCYQVAE